MTDIKILILGDLNVGKTSFVNNIIYNKFNDLEGSTIGVNLNFKNYKVLNENINVCFIDPSGSPRFSFINDTYIKNIGIVFYLFNLSNNESFENIQNKINLFNELNNINSYEYLIGCKSDKISQVDNADIVELCKEYDIKYYPISNKNKSDSELINKVIHKCLLKYNIYDTSSEMNIKIIKKDKVIKVRERDYYCGWLLPC